MGLQWEYHKRVNNEALETPVVEGKCVQNVFPHFKTAISIFNLFHKGTIHTFTDGKISLTILLQ